MRHASYIDFNDVVRYLESNYGFLMTQKGFRGESSGMSANVLPENWIVKT